MERIFDLVIIGAGPAGMSAAIYASRAGLTTLMIEMGAPGGKLVKTHEISNYPGIENINGASLAMQMFSHSTSFSAQYAYGNVVDIIDGEVKQVVCEDTTYECKALIIASGTQEKLLGIKGEEENVGRGVSYCAVCDGAFFADEEVAVIGAGNAALEEALYLTQFASKVHIIMRRDVFRADEIVVNKIKENSKIVLHQKYVPVEIASENNKVSGIVVESNGVTKTIDVKGIFPYIGADPMTQFIKNLDILNSHKYIVVDENMETKCKGIYGAGDVIQKGLRQVVTAVNDGAIAAQHAFHQIKDM